MGPMSCSRNNILKRCTRVLVLAALTAGCSSMSAQEAGYVLGSIAGGVFGSAPGAAAGALLGTAAGSLIAKPMEHAREKKERASLEERLRTSPDGTPLAAAPVMTAAVDTTRPQRIWIDEQVIDGRVMPGHFADRYALAAAPMPLPSDGDAAMNANLPALP